MIGPLVKKWGMGPTSTVAWGLTRPKSSPGGGEGLFKRIFWMI